MPAGSRGDWVRELGPGEGTIAKWKAETLVDDSLFSSSLYLLFGTGSRVTRSSDIFRFICVITWLFFYMLTQFYIKQMPNTRISQIKTWLWEIIVPTAAVCGLWTLRLRQPNATAREDPWLECQEGAAFLVVQGGAVSAGMECALLRKAQPCFTNLTVVQGHSAAAVWQRGSISVRLGLRVLNKETLR